MSSPRNLNLADSPTAWGPPDLYPRIDRTLKIGLVSAFDYAVPGGVNDHIRSLATEFEGWGHDVRVIAPCSAPEKVDDTNFVPMGRSVPIPSRGSIARVSFSVWLRPRIKRLLDAEAFDLIHLHEPFSGFVPLNAIAVSQTTNIGTYHAYPGSRIWDIGGKQLAMRYNRKLHGRIAVSKPARDFINGHYPEDYEIIPNGIQIDDFARDVAPFPHLQDGMINLLFLGRLEKRKGLRHLLAAFSRLKWEWPNLRLLVVGPGRPDPESHRIMSERNLQDVVFVGAVSDEEKVRYYQAADIYCSPATGGESFGVVLLEAMAAGTPTVASAIEGYAGVITDGHDGLLVPPKDDEALADAIDLLLRDPRLRDRLAANGRQRAEEFRWERVARRVMDYYLTVLDSQAALTR